MNEECAVTIFNALTDVFFSNLSLIEVSGAPVGKGFRIS